MSPGGESCPLLRGGTARDTRRSSARGRAAHADQLKLPAGLVGLATVNRARRGRDCSSTGLYAGFVVAYGRAVAKEHRMAGILLWLMGVPLFVIVLLYLIF
jgi:hypothetical protein